jgi:hypothetical protein
MKINCRITKIMSWLRIVASALFCNKLIVGKPLVIIARSY